MNNPTPNISESLAAARERDVRRNVAIGAIAAAILLAALVMGLSRSSTGAIVVEGPNETAEAIEATDTDEVGTVAIVGTGDGEDALTDSEEGALSQTDDSVGFVDVANPVPVIPDAPGPGEPVSLDPVGNSQSHPCDDVLASGENLSVTPDPSILESGVYVSSLTIVNCGTESVDWTAKTKPWVTLTHEASNLGAGSSTDLGFTIDKNAVDLGAFTFKIKVSEPGHNSYVDIHAFRKAVGTDFQPAGIGLTAGPLVGGCANQCITKAWLTANLTSPNLSLEVKTTVDASIKVFVSEGAPQLDEDDNPYFPGKQPSAFTNGVTSQWTTTLSPLDASTTYNIIVKATDNNGKTSYRSGSFKTITPLDNPDGLAQAGEAPGCWNECITKALLTATGEFSRMGLEVKTFLPAKIAVFVSTESTQYNDRVPSFQNTAPHAGTDSNLIEQWSTDLTGLDADTTYNIIVRAVDANSHTAYQVGSFKTGPAPKTDVLVTLHKIHVTHDGDSSWKNRGELSFGWSVANDLVARVGEKKMRDGTTVTFPEHKNKWAVLDAGDYLPTVTVVADERDADGKVEFCSIGLGVPTVFGRSEACDLKWNVATTGIYATEDIDSMTRCSEFGINDNYADSACVLIETQSHGDDYARFWAVVSYHIAD